jgi:hypothetical protein
MKFVSTRDFKHGYLVGAKTEQASNFEPWLVVDTGHGFKFVQTSDIGIRATYYGPHVVFPSVVAWAECNGCDQSDFIDICPWDECFEMSDTYSIVSEAENILYNSLDPAYELSQWLMKSKNWSGSSASMIKGPDEAIAGAFITLHTANPYMLRSLLKWIGVPANIISDVTGIHR